MITSPAQTAAPDPATPAVQIHDLHCSYGHTEAVRGLNLTVPVGRCYGLFGRNGAGKSTTIKCLLNLLRPDSGVISVGGISPQHDEVAVKAQIGYVPEHVSFHPWMTAARVLQYHAAFRTFWNYSIQDELLDRFDLDPRKKVSAMSKGMRSQLALICAVCPEPRLLLLDEPTSGLDPIVRREFLQTVIGAYMDTDPGQRTVLVSTHLIAEWEGLIDQFTIVDKGRELITMQTEDARQNCRRLHVRWSNGTTATSMPEELGVIERSTVEGTTRILTTTYTPETETRLRGLGAELIEAEPLTLEEIFIATANLHKSSAGERA